MMVSIPSPFFINFPVSGDTVHCTPNTYLHLQSAVVNALYDGSRQLPWKLLNPEFFTPPPPELRLVLYS